MKTIKKEKKKMSDKKIKTFVAIILDRSGSMYNISEEAVEGYNSHVRKLKENTEDQDVEMCLVTFNSNVYEHYWLENAKNVDIAHQADYNPDGTTAMLDAMGYTIEKLEESTDPKNENNAYLVITISDGKENASKHVERPWLASKIAELQATKRWTFTFMGCDDRYLKEVAASTNIPYANCAKYSTEKAKVKAGYEGSAAKVDEYMKHRVRSAIRGQSVNTCHFYSADLNCADFTSVVDDGVSNVTPSVLPAGVMSSAVTPPLPSDNFARKGKIENVVSSTGTNVFDGKQVAWK